jgi:hypothetical protein
MAMAPMPPAPTPPKVSCVVESCLWLLVLLVPFGGLAMTGVYLIIQDPCVKDVLRAPVKWFWIFFAAGAVAMVMLGCCAGLFSLAMRR